MTEITKASPGDAGCWIDGHWGQYGVARMVAIASELGYVDTAAIPPFATSDVVQLAARHLADMGPNDGTEHGMPPLEDSEWEDLLCASDDVEAWLNANVAPEGFAFGWHDGEFFLQSDTWWEDENPPASCEHWWVVDTTSETPNDPEGYVYCEICLSPKI